MRSYDFNFNFSYFAHTSMEKKEPRGLRNNNPLNIRHGMSQWQGTSPHKTDREFVCYMSKAYGYRAAWKILQTYYRHCEEQREPFCLRTILMRWAPPTDGNDTEAYIHRVMVLSGVGGQQILPAPNSKDGYQRLHRILVAMTCVENGIKPEQVEVEHILKGYRLAFPLGKLKN